MRRVLRALMIVGVLAGGMTVATAPQPAQAAVTCEKFATLTIQGGRYNVQNNVWGADTTQCIDSTSSGLMSGRLISRLASPIRSTEA